MAAVGDIVRNGNSIAKYVSASINFATATAGNNAYGATTWEEPVPVLGVQLHCVRTVALANGTNTELGVQVKISPDSDTWRTLYRYSTPGASTDAGAAGLTWTNANTVCEFGAVGLWSATGGDEQVPLNIYGMRVLVTRDAGDATLAGTVTNVWLSTVPWV